MTELTTQFERVARALESARALVITAGAGMGVDSGLPDFRGNEGFWRAYPPYKNLGLGFSSLANPKWFANDPEFAWGFTAIAWNFIAKRRRTRDLACCAS